MVYLTHILLLLCIDNSMHLIIGLLSQVFKTFWVLVVVLWLIDVPCIQAKVMNGFWVFPSKWATTKRGVGASQLVCKLHGALCFNWSFFVILCVLIVLNVGLGCSAEHFDFKCEHQSCGHFEYLDNIIIILCSSLLKPS